MSHNLSYTVKTKRILNAVAAGKDEKACTEIDISGFDGVRFVALLGKTANNGKAALKVAGTPKKGDYGREQGAKTIHQTEYVIPATDDNKTILVDIYKPKFRYLKASVLRGTANTTIDGVIAEFYKTQNAPCEVDETISKQAVLNGG